MSSKLIINEKISGFYIGATIYLLSLSPKKIFLSRQIQISTLTHGPLNLINEVNHFKVLIFIKIEKKKSYILISSQTLFFY